MVYCLWQHEQMDLGWALSPYLMPLMLGIGFVLLGLWGMLSPNPQGEKSAPQLSRRMILVLAMVVIYVILLPVLGFVLATGLALLALTRYLGEKRLWVNLTLSFGVSVGLYLLFARLLHVLLP